jgi:subfamily B ATP-binding cassette protein MsbA
VRNPKAAPSAPKPPAPVRPARGKFRLFFAFLRPYRWNLGMVVGLTIVLSVLAMLPPLFMRLLIDRVLTQGDRGLLLGLGVCILAVPAVSALCRYIQSTSIAFVGQRFVLDLRRAVYDHLLRLSLRFFGKHSVGKLVNRLMGDSTTIQHMITAQSINVISDLVCASFAITAAVAISWRLTLLLLGLVVLFVVNYQVNIPRLRRVSRTYQGALDRLSGGVQNRLAVSLAVKTFGMERKEHGVFQGELGTSLDLVQEAGRAGMTFWMNTELIRSAGYLLIYFLGCAMILRGDLSYGDVVAFSTYAMQLLWPAVNFSELARNMQGVGIAMDRLFELYQEVPEVVETPDAVAPGRLRGEVVFEDVSFHYDPEKPVLAGFSLRVEAGETVALIGPTGCGKTTLLSLIMRFYDVVGGRLLLDGTDIRRYRLLPLRRQFGIVLQEPLLFHISVADNIRYARLDATRAELEAAARVAEIHDFILTLPQGYDTVLGREGLDLSVGQKQRITIARAVVADPAILFMDEATSALDSESERAIQTAMARVLKGRTAFIVAHRLSTIRNADRIVLLDQGRIAEMGRHEDLMARPDGRYRHLYLTHMGTGVLTE